MRIKRRVPSNLNELIDFDWLPFMRQQIKKFNLRDTLNDPDDIIQDMLLLMCKNHFIEKYDPQGRPFEVYLAIFVSNFMCKRYKKEALSQNGRNIVNAKGIEFSAPQDVIESGDPNIVYLDRIGINASNEEDSAVLIESLRQELKKYKASSHVVHEGKEYARDPATVLELLIKGLDPLEIAEIFHTSRQFVYLLIKKIRACEALEEYRR